MNGWCCGRGGRRANRLGTRANSPFYPRNNDETSFFLFLVKMFLIFSQKGISSVLSLFYFMWYMLEKPDVPGGGAHCVHLSDGWLSGTLSQNIWKKLNISKCRGFQLIQQLGWVASFSHLKARVNESNALLGWMIYYFVFWLLPMQVDRDGHDQFRCWLTFDMNMIIIIWLKWECDFNQICFKDYKLGLAKQEGKVILLFDSFE